MKRSALTLVVGALAIAPAPTSVASATALKKCSSSASYAIALKAKGVPCKTARSLAKAVNRGDEIERIGETPDFKLRGYTCTTRETDLNEEGNGTMHFDCRDGARRVVWKWRP